MPSGSKKQSTTIVVRSITHGSRQATKTVLGTLGELNRHAPLVSLPLTFAPHIPSRELPPAAERPALPALPLRSVSGSELMALPSVPQEEIAPDLLVTPKPWKQYPRIDVWEPDVRRRSRRNAGRDDGQSWRSDSYLCGRAFDSSRDDQDALDDTIDHEEEEWIGDWREDVRQNYAVHSYTSPRREVPIMDIAKPMKPRGEVAQSTGTLADPGKYRGTGVAKDFEMLDTVRRVIALDEDQRAEWMDDQEEDLALQEWESLEWESASGHEHKASYAAKLRQRPD
ncbi:hypothetical protein ACG7TL_002044 [Trametes sanguinea]